MWTPKSRPDQWPWVSRRLWVKTIRAGKGPEEEVVVLVVAETPPGFASLIWLLWTRGTLCSVCREIVWWNQSLHLCWPLEGPPFPYMSVDFPHMPHLSLAPGLCGRSVS